MIIWRLTRVFIIVHFGELLIRATILITKFFINDFPRFLFLVIESLVRFVNIEVLYSDSA